MLTPYPPRKPEDLESYPSAKSADGRLDLSDLMRPHDPGSDPPEATNLLARQALEGDARQFTLLYERSSLEAGSAPGGNREGA